MTSIELPHGVVNFRVTGPTDSAAPPVLFVHPFLMDGSLWSGVADLLAAQGIRSYAPDRWAALRRCSPPPSCRSLICAVGPPEQEERR
jgi:pimeloyl-ACP methyl ester carboxylesterase